MWNRFIDSTDDHEIVKIERRIFDSVVETVVKDQGEWSTRYQHNEISRAHQLSESYRELQFRTRYTHSTFLN